MEIKKLFHVLVMGGAALAMTHCGPDKTTDNQNLNGQQTTTVSDGGTPVDDGGTTEPGGGGPVGW